MGLKYKDESKLDGGPPNFKFPEIDCFSGLRLSVITPWGVGAGFPFPSSLEEGQSLTEVILC